MFHKVSIFVDSALRKHLESTPDASFFFHREKLFTAFQLITHVVLHGSCGQTVIQYNFISENVSENVRKFLDGSSNESRILRQKLQVAHRIEVTISSGSSNGYKWSLHAFKKSETIRYYGLQIDINKDGRAIDIWSEELEF